MLARLNTPVRAVLLAAALAFATHAPDVRATSEPVPTTARSTARTRTDQSPQEEAPVSGLLIVVGIVGVVIVLAWVCSRFGDSR